TGIGPADRARKKLADQRTLVPEAAIHRLLRDAGGVGDRRDGRPLVATFHLEIEDVAVVDNVVWLRMTGSGTPEGPYMGHEPTGRKMKTPVFDAIRVEDAKIVEHWGVPDRLYALVQLGLVTPPPSQRPPGAPIM